MIDALIVLLLGGALGVIGSEVIAHVRPTAGRHALRASHVHRGWEGREAEVTTLGAETLGAEDG